MCARGGKRGEKALAQLGGNAGAVVLHGQQQVAALQAVLDVQLPLGSGHGLHGLQGVEQQVVQDLLQGNWIGLGGGQRGGGRWRVQLHLALAQLGFQQVQRIGHGLRQGHGLGLGGGVGAFHQTAQPADHGRGALGLLGRLLHGLARGVHTGFGIVQQAACGLAVGEDGRQRLVQFMGHAGGQLAQRVQAGNLAVLQQLLGPLARGALLPGGPQRGHHQGAGQRPGAHAPPGLHARVQLVAFMQLQHLAGGGQGFVHGPGPAGGAGIGCAGLQHQVLAALAQPDTHGAVAGGVRPFALRNGGAQVQLEGVAGGLAGLHHVQLAVGQAAGIHVCMAAGARLLL